MHRAAPVTGYQSGLTHEARDPGMSARHSLTLPVPPAPAGLRTFPARLMDLDDLSGQLGIGVRASRGLAPPHAQYPLGETPSTRHIRTTA